jgi:hypothetical protein
MVGGAAIATWEEAELLQHSMVARGGDAGARRLGVEPRRVAEVLGTAPS